MHRRALAETPSETNRMGNGRRASFKRRKLRTRVLQRTVFARGAALSNCGQARREPLGAAPSLPRKNGES